MSCKAIRQGDQMQCGPCGLQWDIDDPEPPACMPSGTAVVPEIVGPSMRDLIKSGNLSGAEARRLLHCELKQDKRAAELDTVLSQYYADTPEGTDGQEALMYWRMFTRWCNEWAYTTEEINAAKRRCAKNI